MGGRAMDWLGMLVDRGNNSAAASTEHPRSATGRRERQGQHRHPSIGRRASIRDHRSFQQAKRQRRCRARPTPPGDLMERLEGRFGGRNVLGSAIGLAQMSFAVISIAKLCDPIHPERPSLHAAPENTRRGRDHHHDQHKQCGVLNAPAGTRTLRCSLNRVGRDLTGHFVGKCIG